MLLSVFWWNFVRLRPENRRCSHVFLVRSNSPVDRSTNKTTTPPQHRAQSKQLKPSPLRYTHISHLVICIHHIWVKILTIKLDLIRLILIDFFPEFVQKILYLYRSLFLTIFIWKKTNSNFYLFNILLNFSKIWPF